MRSFQSLPHERGRNAEAHKRIWFAYGNGLHTCSANTRYYLWKSDIDRICDASRIDSNGKSLCLCAKGLGMDCGNLCGYRHYVSLCGGQRVVSCVEGGKGAAGGGIEGNYELRMKNISVFLGVFSVNLCVTKNNYTGNTRRNTEIISIWLFF